MPLGMEAGLGPGNFVLDGDPALPPQKGGRARDQFSLCDELALSVNICLSRDELKLALL